MNYDELMQSGEIIPFPGYTPPAWEEKDMECMTAQELREFLEDIREELTALDEDEPEDETSEEFVDWAERHEELEDLADEAIERLEELGEPEE